MSLKDSIQQAAESFANEIMSEIMSSNLDDLLAGRGPTRTTNGHTPRKYNKAAGPTARARAVNPSSGKKRLKRRTQADIDKTLDRVCDLLKGGKMLRAEAIREKLGVDRRELPRVLSDGLKSKRLACKGQKRATTYRLAGAKPKAVKAAKPKKKK